MPRTAVASSAVTRSADSGLDRNSPIRLATEKPASFSRTTASDRKLVATNSDSDEPMASLRFGMIAVCGIGSPSGRLNSAVTANQSASAPTMPASAIART